MRAGCATRAALGPFATGEGEASTATIRTLIRAPSAVRSIAHLVGIVAEVVFETSFPLSPIALGDAFDLSLAEDVEAVHECDADVDFGGLAVGVS